MFGGILPEGGLRSFKNPQPVQRGQKQDPKAPNISL